MLVPNEALKRGTHAQLTSSSGCWWWVSAGRQRTTLPLSSPQSTTTSLCCSLRSPPNCRLLSAETRRNLIPVVEATCSVRRGVGVPEVERDTSMFTKALRMSHRPWKSFWTLDLWCYVHIEIKFTGSSCVVSCLSESALQITWHTSVSISRTTTVLNIKILTQTGTFLKTLRLHYDCFSKTFDSSTMELKWINVYCWRNHQCFFITIK